RSRRRAQYVFPAAEPRRNSKVPETPTSQADRSKRSTPLLSVAWLFVPAAIERASTLSARPAEHLLNELRCEQGTAPCKLTKMRVLRRVPSERLHVHHPRHRFDRAGDLRRDLEAAWELHFDFGLQVEHDDQRHVAIGTARRRGHSFRLRSPGRAAGRR